NKPAGVVSAVTDQEHQTVIDLISPQDSREGLYPVGRLDRDTEGLVLITNNGSIGYRMLHPSHHVDKVYYVEVNGPLGLDAPTFFASGVTFLDGTRCQPADLTVLEASLDHSRATIKLAEGKFHQVKKMFLAYGVKVTYLKRISFGGFELGDLERGAYRQLTPNEMEHLFTYFD
ncbi:TPA: pseudouridine synthase, partial [Streptococcus suis]|nr:pseudouridine synthase [Streptococcus suis]